MKFTVHVEGTKTEIASQLLDAVALFNGSGAGAAPAATSPAKSAKKPAKVEEPAAAEEAEEDEGEFDLGEEESEDEGEEEEDAAPKLEDVIAGFKDYAKKKSRDKAAAVLAKFKVKSVRDLKTSQYAEVLKALGVKK